MANANRPSGLSPVQYLNGAPWSGQVRVYCILQANGSAFAIGDPVSSGGSADSNGVPSLSLGVVGTAFRGVIVSSGGIVNGSYYADPTNLNTTVIPATKTKNYYVGVVDDPNVLYEVQEDSVGGALVAADIGLNCSLIAAANNGFLSGWMLDTSTKATTAALDVKILGLIQRNDNAFGNLAKVLVWINNSEFHAGVLGV